MCFLTHTFVAFFFSCFILMTSAQAALPTGYEIYYTDVNNDGVVDIYFHSSEYFVPIHYDIVVPLFVTSESYVLVRNGSGYTAQFTSTLSDAQVAALPKAQQDVDYFQGNFSGTSASELLIRGNNSNGLAAMVSLDGGGNLPSIIQTLTSTSLSDININDRSVNFSITDMNDDGRDDIAVSSDQIYLATASGAISAQYIGTAYLELISATGVGSTPASFEVNAGGGALYTVPINVPTGAAGLKPSIALRYSSQSHNGVVGLGWQLLTGLARIDHCFKRNTDQIVHCLNNEELISVGGGYYRTEVDSGVLVQAVNSDTYVLHYDNGSKKTLTRQLSSPDLFLEVSHDQRGGASYNVTWDLQSNEREPLVSRIDYQGNRIEFDYETRSDARTGYLMESIYKRTQRLKQITALVDGQVYRRYNVHYQYDDVSQVSKVTHIQECGSDGECLKPLSFDWSSSGSRGFGSAAGNLLGAYGGLYDPDNDGTPIGVPSAGPYFQRMTGDVDGDGRDDIVDLWNVNTGHISYTPGDNAQRYAAWFFIRYANGTTEERFYREGTGSEVIPHIVDIIDFDGDKKEEIVITWGIGRLLKIDGESSSLSLPAIPASRALDGACDVFYGYQVGDFNGDGLPDITYSKNTDEHIPSDVAVCYESYAFQNKGNGQFELLDYEVFGGQVDINGDGILDSVRWNYSNPTTYYSLSSGSGLASQHTLNGIYTFVDVNADSLPDALSKHSNPPNYIRYNNGLGGFHSGVWTSSSHFILGDVNGDGSVDHVNAQGVVHHGQAHRPYIQGFNDSYGNQHQVAYSRLTDSSVYTRDVYGSTSLSGQHPYMEPTTVVKSVTSPTSKTHYKYAGAKMHNGRHGYLGFSSMTSVVEKADQQGTPTSIVSTSYMNQQFPLVGRVTSKKTQHQLGTAASVIGQVTYSPSGNQLIARINGTEVGHANPLMRQTSAWQYFIWTGGVYKPYLYQQTEEDYQLSNGALVRSTTSTHNWAAVGGRYSRLQSSNVSRKNNQGQTVQEQNISYYYNITDTYGTANSYNPGEIYNVTTSYDIAGEGLIADAHSLVSGYDYFSNGLLRFERTLLGSDLGTRIAYLYDNYGNLTSTSTSALIPRPGYSEQVREVNRTYTSQGKYRASETNALGHTTTYSQFDVHGTPQRVDDANGLVSYQYSDGFGRTDRIVDHLGNEHYSQRGLCATSSLGCTNGAYSWEKSEPAGAAHSYQFYDVLGRSVKTATQSLESDQWVLQGWEYDQFGRPVKESIPVLGDIANAVVFGSHSSGQQFTATTYDEVDRIVVQQLPGINRVVTKDYTNELAIVTIDPANRQTINYRNGLDLIVRKQQQDNTEVSFVYNAQGLVTSQRYPKLDSAGAIQLGQYNEITNAYDRAGNRISENDPNAGTWTFAYNIYGEQVQQTDALGQTTLMAYDELGRVVSQRDNDTYSAWAYDQEEKGLLDQASQYNITALSSTDKALLTPANVAAYTGVSLSYQQAFSYNDTNKLPEWVQTQQRDSANQLVSSIATSDYDQFARLQYQELPAIYKQQGTLTAPRVEYQYSATGYLSQIKDRDSNHVYQDVEQIDAFGNITVQTLGDHVELYRDYDQSTGWATELQALSNGYALVEQSYGGYNGLGFIGTRADTSYYNSAANYQTWSDTFTYDDGLKQQLTGATVQYQQDLNSVVLNQNWSHSYSYDALGNMRSNTFTLEGYVSDLHYQYNDVTKPHQLTGTTGRLNRQYSYDANGSALADGEKSYTYNPWNKIKQLTKGSDSSRFEYGLDRKRYLRVDQAADSTTETLYVGNSYQRVSTLGTVPANTTDTTEHKYYIGMIALTIQTEGANTEKTFAQVTDYQDSLLALVDESGIMTQRFRYTPFGKQVVVSDGVTGISNLTTKGYTSHEHIEAMDIIHMNGRIYDPVIGRMVQADIVVQAPELITSYNRFAYVWNNPLNATDPSGYERIGDEGDTRTFDQAQADYENTSGDQYDYGYHSGETQASSGDGNIGDNDLQTQLLPHENPELPGLYGTCFTCPHPSNDITLGGVVDGAIYVLDGLPPQMGGIVTKGPRIASSGLKNFFEAIRNFFRGVPKGLAGVPGRVQSRINLEKGGLKHTLNRHLNPASSGSQFSLSKDGLASLLQSKQVVGSPITRVLDSGNFLRQVNVGRNIGFDKFNGNKATSTLSVITDKFGNLVTATPGVIK